MALDLLGLRSIVSGRRVQVDAWRMDSTRTGRAAFWVVVPRNWGRARRRRLRSLAAPKVSGEGPIPRGAAEISNEPSEDGIFPQVSKQDFVARS